MANDRGVPLSRRSVWTSQIFSIVGLLAFVFLVRWANPLLHPGGQAASVEVGLLLVVLPAILWLVLFYVQDHREPEPLHYIFNIAIIGAMYTGAFAIPLIENFFDVGSWLSPTQNYGFLFLGSILIVGAIQEFCKYLAVRQTVFDNDEFDEVGDGIIYGAAAGLGVATMLNLSFVLSSPSIDALNTTIRIVITALAHASFGGVTGYFLGKAKIEGKYGSMTIGYLLAVILNGAFTVVLSKAPTWGLKGNMWVNNNPWNGLILAAAVSFVITLILFGLVRAHSKTA